MLAIRERRFAGPGEECQMHRRSVALALAILAAPPAWRVARGQAASWRALFNGRDMAGWNRVGDANWRVEDGALVADRGNGFLVSQESFGDFELRTEFFADTHTNSGIFIRAQNPAVIASATSYEVNIWDERPEPRFGTGAIVDVAAVDPMPKAGGRWNSMEITAQGDALSVVLNGQRTVDRARDARFRSGPIALQHGNGVPGPGGAVNDGGVIRFRRVEIRTL
jgi:hypothetical protein